MVSLPTAAPLPASPVTPDKLLPTPLRWTVGDPYTFAPSLSSVKRILYCGGAEFVGSSHTRIVPCLSGVARQFMACCHSALAGGSIGEWNSQKPHKSQTSLHCFQQHTVLMGRGCYCTHNSKYYHTRLEGKKCGPR